MSLFSLFYWSCDHILGMFPYPMWLLRIQNKIEPLPVVCAFLQKRSEKLGERYYDE